MKKLQYFSQLLILLLLAGFSAQAQNPSTVNLYGRVLRLGTAIGIPNVTVTGAADTLSIQAGNTFNPVLATTDSMGNFTLTVPANTAAALSYRVYTYDCNQNIVANVVHTSNYLNVTAGALYICQAAVQTTVVISGRVTDQNAPNTGLAGRIVRIAPDSFSASTGNNFTPFNVLTNATGYYTANAPYSAANNYSDYVLSTLDCNNLGNVARGHSIGGAPVTADFYLCNWSDTITISGRLTNSTTQAGVPNYIVNIDPDTLSLLAGNIFNTISLRTDSLGYYSTLVPARGTMTSALDYLIYAIGCNNTYYSRIGRISAGVGIITNADLSICASSRDSVTISGQVGSSSAPFGPIANHPVKIAPDTTSAPFFNTFVVYTNAQGTYSARVPYNVGLGTNFYVVSTPDCNGNLITGGGYSTGGPIVDVSFAICEPPVSSASLAGSIYYANGTRAQGATIIAYKLGSDFSAITQDSNGYYTFASLPAGQYIVQAWLAIPSATLGAFATYAPSTTTFQNASVFTLISGALSTADITLAIGDSTVGPNSLNGTLTGDSAAGNLRVSYMVHIDYSRARVILADANGTDRYSAAVDASGRWSFSNLPNGTYKARVEYPKVSCTPINLTLPATSSIRFVVDGSGHLIGTQPTGTARNMAQKLVMYPNPVNTQLQLNGEALDLSTLRLVNATGQTIQPSVSGQAGSYTVSTEVIAPGLYTLLVTGTDGQAFTGKIVKQ